MIFTLSACSSGDESSQTTTVDPSVTQDPATTTVDLTAPLDVKVGFVYNDKVENSTISSVFEAARKEIGSALGVETCYIEGVLVADFIQAVDKLEQDGCNIIVAASHKYMNSVKSLSRTSSETKFVCFGGNATLSNMTTFDPKLYQPVHVAGTVAAYNTDSNILGVVADPNMYSVCAIIDAYALGAKNILGTETDIRLNTAASSSQAQTKKAIDDLVSQGCDVIMMYQSTTYGITYCESIGVKVIGFASNMPELAPKTYLTGFFYNLNTYLTDIVSKIRFRSFTSELFQDGLKSGAIKLTSLSSNVKGGTANISDALYKLVESEGTGGIFQGELKDNTNTIKVQKGSYLIHSLITTVNWIEKSVTSVNDFTEPITEGGIVSSDFEIKY